MNVSPTDHRQKSLHHSTANYIRQAQMKAAQAPAAAPVDPTLDHPVTFSSIDDIPTPTGTPAANGNAAAAGPSKPWTILYYGAADNDLYPFIYQDVAKMETVGSDAASNLVVQLDSKGGTTQRFLIEKDGPSGDPKKIDSPVLEDLGKVNSSDPATLSNFIQWGINKYPAEHYILVIADHGKGWKGCIADESHNGWMELPQLKDALSTAQAATGKKLDILGFDACLMASTEVAYELRDQAKYLVGSQEVEGAEGWPYNLILDPNALQAMSMTGAMSPHAGEPKQIAQYLVARAGTDGQTIPTMSAIDLGRIVPVADAARELKDSIIGEKVNGRDLRILRKEVQPFNDFNDLHDFANRLKDSTTITSQKVKDSAVKLQEALDGAVIAEQHSDKYPGAHGLTAELRWPRGYDKTAFAKDTGWGDLVQYMNT